MESQLCSQGLHLASASNPAALFASTGNLAYTIHQPLSTPGETTAGGSEVATLP